MRCQEVHTDTVTDRADVTDMMKDTDRKAAITTVKDMNMENVIIMVKGMVRKTAIMARATDRCMDMDLATAGNTTEDLAGKGYSA